MSEESLSHDITRARGTPAADPAKKLRIGVLSYGLPVPGKKRGGIERVAHDLADALARRGHDVIVWTHDPAPDGAAYRVKQLPARSFVETWIGRRATMGYLGNLLPLALASELRRRDVLVAHGDSVLLSWLGPPFVRVFHGSALEEARHAISWLRRTAQYGVHLQERWCAKHGVSVAVSENTRARLGKITHVIPNGIDLTVFRPDATKRSAAPSILFVGALGGRKRGGLLIDWFQRDVRYRHPCAELHMVCETGPASPGVHYHTGLTQSELVERYQSAWIYASPSTYEGFGLPYVEALATGTPVVATPNPGSREILDAGTFGILADDADFGPALARLLSDETARHSLSGAGVARARKFSLERTTDAYETLLGGLVEARRSGNRPPHRR